MILAITFSTEGAGESSKEARSAVARGASRPDFDESGVRAWRSCGVWSCHTLQVCLTHIMKKHRRDPAPPRPAPAAKVSRLDRAVSRGPCGCCDCAGFGGAVFTPSLGYGRLFNGCLRQWLPERVAYSPFSVVEPASMRGRLVASELSFRFNDHNTRSQ